jgi:hypothetical protein
VHHRRDRVLQDRPCERESQRHRHRTVRLGAALAWDRRRLETKQFSNISATTAAFTLTGGRYAFIVTATFGGGTVALQVLSGDGSTFVNVSNQTAAAAVTVDLPPGSYRIQIATATAVFVTLGRVPS